MRRCAAEVERDVRASAAERCDAVRLIEARRLLVLNGQEEELRRALDAVQRCADAAAAACSAPLPPLRFLQRCPALADAAERLAVKPVREGTEVKLAEFEREARAAAARADADVAVLRKLLAVKDEMIWCAQPARGLACHVA